MYLNDPRLKSEVYPSTNSILNQALLEIKKNNSDNSILIELLQNNLNKQNDALINIAINLAPDVQTSQYIWQSLVTAMNFPQQNTWANIFAIPIVIVIGSKTNTTIPGQINVDKINKSFIDKKLFKTDMDCFISGKLIDPITISKFTQSQINYWIKNLKNANLWLPLNLDGQHIENIKEGVYLRFLVGITIDEKANSGLIKANFTNLSMDLMKLLNDELKTDGATIFPIPFPPCFVNEAYIKGDNYRKEIAIAVSVSNIVKIIRENRENPIVKITTTADSIKIKVFAKNNPKLQEKSVWQLSRLDNFIEITDKLINLFKDMQVEVKIAN